MTPAPAAGTEVAVRAGETASNVRLTPVNANPSQRPTAKATVLALAETPPPSLEGTVTDTSGRPLPNATIFALVPYNGAFIPERSVEETTTDSDGHYRFGTFPGEPSRDGWTSSATQLFAAHSGCALAESTPVNSSAPRDSADKIRADFVLAPANSGLKVRVLRDGLPAANAIVFLSPDGDMSPLPADFLLWSDYSPWNDLRQYLQTGSGNRS